MTIQVAKVGIRGEKEEVMIGKGCLDAIGVVQHGQASQVLKTTEPRRPGHNGPFHGVLLISEAILESDPEWGQVQVEPKSTPRQHIGTIKLGMLDVSGKPSCNAELELVPIRDGKFRFHTRLRAENDVGKGTSGSQSDVVVEL